MTAAQMQKFLESRGFRVVSQRGSHMKMTDGVRVAIVPVHSGDLPTGTLSKILRDIDSTKADAKKWAGSE